MEYVLITGSDDEVSPMLERSLTAALPVRRCPGPSAIDCPAVHRQACALRKDAKAAVVYLAGEHEFHSPGRWQCVMAGSSPAVAVVPGTSTVRGAAPFTIVGSEAGPLGVLQALAEMFDSPPVESLDLDWD